MYWLFSSYIQGWVTVLSSLAELRVNRGWKMPLWIQRSSSSASGAWPAKPPMSQPMLGQPDRPIPTMVAMLNLTVRQSVRLSPPQTWA